MNCSYCNTPVPESSRFCLACGANLSDPGGAPRATATGPQLTARLTQALEGRYRLESMLGRGGMGAVFLAHDLTLERPVAIKVLPPDVSHDDNLVARFEREARTAAKLDHPNIIPIFAVESAGGLHYFVMKYVNGRSLDDLLSKNDLPIEVCQRVLWEAAMALGHAHTRGVVHRDIKPGNIMLDHDDRVMLADFGISKAMQSATQYTGTGQVIGTPHYMSPEQAKGKQVDGRSDQYSLAVVAYQMLTGGLPFSDESVHTVLYKHIFEDPPGLLQARPETPPALADAVHRALAKDPADRYETMEQFALAACPDRRPSGSRIGAETLRTSVASAPTEITTPEPPPTLPRTQRVGRRRRSRIVMAVIPVLIGIGGAGYWSWSSGMLNRLLGGPTAVGATVADSGAAGSTMPTDEGISLATAAARHSVEASPPIENPPDQRPQRTRSPARKEPPPPSSQAPTPAPRTPARRIVQPAPPRLGSLTVAADPFGTVWVDDVEIGDTPLVNHALQPGQHVIRIAREGCRTVVDTVTVAIGRPARMRKTLVCDQP